MEKISKIFSCVNAIFALIFAVTSVNAQISSPCTSAMLNSFTPCLNYITGSTANGGSPTADCCNSVKSVMSTSVDCACLIVTGNVPFSLPINRALAISLPKACRNAGVDGVPLKCKASGVPLPAPGPSSSSSIAASPLSPRASKASAAGAESPEADTDTDITPEASPPTATPGIRPVLTPSSASTPSHITSTFLLAAFLGLFMIINSY